MSFSDKVVNIDIDTVNNSIVKTATISTVTTTFTTATVTRRQNHNNVKNEEESPDIKKTRVGS